MSINNIVSLHFLNKFEPYPISLECCHLLNQEKAKLPISLLHLSIEGHCNVVRVYNMHVEAHMRASSCHTWINAITIYEI